MISHVMSALVVSPPSNWPSTPFHEGELKLQERFGVRETVDSYAPKVVRHYMPDQHRAFYSAQPFLVAAARDEHGQMWSTFLTDPDGENNFVTSPSPTTLSIRAQPSPGDALEHTLRQPNVDLGLIGIEFATKRRNRVNGRTISSSYPNTIDFRVDQSFGNCPQYITPRRWWRTAKSGDQNAATKAPRSLKSSSLSEQQMRMIRNADTLFLATGFRGEGEDPRWGNDASHRGGEKGFLRVKDANTILLPDYAGNNHYNTLGNLIMDNRIGITIPSFSDGGLLQMTGRAEITYSEVEAKLATKDDGAKRMITFTIDQVNELPAGSLPIRWAENDTLQSTRSLQVTHKIKESDEVTSFYFQAVKGDDTKLWNYLPGQHLPILLKTTTGNEVSRTYSLSSGAGWGEYRISVKCEPYGLVSQFLHDTVTVGDTIQVNQPAGDFALDETSDRTLVLISSGIGVTPVLSMLHTFASSNPSSRKRKAIWVHGARDGKHHPFRGEVQELAALAGDSLRTHVAYSKPRDTDMEHNSIGRIDAALLEKLVPDLKNADYYMCGSSSFMADVQDGLESLGVDPNRIQFEQF